MPQPIVVHVDVDAPPDVVWAVLVDVERWPELTPSMTRVRLMTPGPLALGSEAEIEQPRLPRQTWTVTEFGAGRCFVWQARGPGAVTRGAHELTARPDGGTDLALSIASTGPLAGLVQALLGGLTRRYVTAEAAGLKRASEERHRGVGDRTAPS